MSIGDHAFLKFDASPVFGTEPWKSFLVTRHEALTYRGGLFVVSAPTYAEAVANLRGAVYGRIQALGGHQRTFEASPQLALVADPPEWTRRVLEQAVPNDPELAFEALGVAMRQRRPMDYEGFAWLAALDAEVLRLLLLEAANGSSIALAIDAPSAAEACKRLADLAAPVIGREQACAVLAAVLDSLICVRSVDGEVRPTALFLPNAHKECAQAIEAARWPDVARFERLHTQVIQSSPKRGNRRDLLAHFVEHIPIERNAWVARSTGVECY